MTAPRDTLPAAVYTAAQVRELDRMAIEDRGIPGYELMCRAGQAALDVLKSAWPDAHKLTVWCGAGNNAGDGYVVARLARAAGMSVRLEAVVPPERLRGDAQKAWQDCRDAGIEAEAFETGRPGAAGFVPDVIIDALLGTGLDRPVEGAFADAVAEVGAAGVPVLSLDIPSGLDADSGRVLGTAVRADVTVTFVGLKQGLFLGDAPDHVGRIAFSDLMLPPELAAALEPALERLSPALLRMALPRRPRSAHKGGSGRVLLVGGGPGMSGAIRLAAEAALRVGAGLVHVATHADSVGTVMSGRPEIMCHAVDSPEDADALLKSADAVVLGPGLGRSDWARALWQRVVTVRRPLIVDADGLNLLAEHPFTRDQWLLTPHPGEAGRLLGQGTAAVQSDRLAAVRAVAGRFNAVTVLKGAGTLVAAPATASAGQYAAPSGQPVAPLSHPGRTSPPVAVCDYGNPGMATAGMGDVLSGVLGGLLGQLNDVALTARAGTLLHALAGDDAAAAGERGMVAADLMPALRRWANPV